MCFQTECATVRAWGKSWRLLASAFQGVPQLSDTRASQCWAVFLVGCSVFMGFSVWVRL